MEMREIMNLVEGAQRIDELQGVKAHTSQKFTNKLEVYRYLISKGFSILGTGQYGAVFDHPSFRGRYVLKVFADTFYEAYLNWVVKQGGGNPHLPGIVGKVMKLTPDASMVRIERLQELPREQYNRLYARRIADILNYPNKFPQSEMDKLVPHADREGLRDLYKTLIDISYARPSGAMLDLNPGNFMKRGGTIVITDPYCGAKMAFQP